MITLLKMLAFLWSYFVTFNIQKIGERMKDAFNYINDKFIVVKSLKE